MSAIGDHFVVDSWTKSCDSVARSGQMAIEKGAFQNRDPSALNPVRHFEAFQCKPPSILPELDICLFWLMMMVHAGIIKHRSANRTPRIDQPIEEGGIQE